MTGFPARWLFLSALVLLVACGGGDDASTADADGAAAGAVDLASVERYAGDLTAAKMQFDAALPPSLAGAAVADVVTRLRAENMALEGLAAALEGMSAPSPVDEMHATFASLTRGRIELQAQMADDIEDRDMIADDDPLRRETAFADWIAARCDLERAVRDLGIELALGCTTLEVVQEQPAALDRLMAELPIGSAACTAVSEPREEIEYGQTAYTVFVNLRDEPVRLYRYNVALERELVTTIPASEDVLEVHLLGAGWLVTDLEDECIGGTRPLSAGFVVTIR